MLASAASKRSTCATVAGPSSTAWKCVHTPRSSTPGAAATRPAADATSAGRKPPRPSPVSTSSSSRSGPNASRLRRGRQRRRQARRVADGERDVEPGGLGREAGRYRVEHEDRDADAARAQRERLVDRGHAEAVRTGRLEGERDGHRPVTVGIGLDDRHDRHARAGGIAQQRQVRRDRIEVDLEPRGPGQRRQPGLGQAVLDRRARPSGRRHAAARLSAARRAIRSTAEPPRRPAAPTTCRA